MTESLARLPEYESDLQGLFFYIRCGSWTRHPALALIWGHSRDTTHLVHITGKAGARSYSSLEAVTRFGYCHRET